MAGCLPTCSPTAMTPGGADMATATDHPAAPDGLVPPLVWVHDDALGPGNPAVLASPGSPRVFVFDPTVIESRLYGLKRLMFLYEAASDLGCHIYRGSVVEAVTHHARMLDTGTIMTVETPCPRLNELMRELAVDHKLEVLPRAPFVGVGDRKVDLKRFSRYWRRVEDRAFLTTDQQAD